MDYICPNCGSNLFIVEITQSGFKYKARCFYCSYYDYLTSLKELKTRPYGQ